MTASSVRRVVLRADGAARGNPGPAAIGVVLVAATGSGPAASVAPTASDAPDGAAALDGAAVPDGAPLATISEALGRTTNNVAEYTAVLRGLELARELGAREVDLLLDSQLVVEQLRGRWRVRDPKLIPLWMEVRRLLGGFERWSARHVPRAQNRAADALANAALDRVERGGPASVVDRSPGSAAASQEGRGSR